MALHIVQTPFTHDIIAHSTARSHGSPGDFTQRLSTQRPLAHSTAEVQISLGRNPQPPPPLHTYLPSHTGLESSEYLGSAEQLPGSGKPHEAQIMSHAEVQQRPSAQKPLMQSSELAQNSPKHFLHGNPQSTPFSPPFCTPSKQLKHSPKPQ
jgi:hypothetical protein